MNLKNANKGERKGKTILSTEKAGKSECKNWTNRRHLAHYRALTFPNCRSLLQPKVVLEIQKKSEFTIMEGASK